MSAPYPDLPLLAVDKGLRVTRAEDGFRVRVIGSEETVSRYSDKRAFVAGGVITEYAGEWKPLEQVRAAVFGVFGNVTRFSGYPFDQNYGIVGAEQPESGVGAGSFVPIDTSNTNCELKAFPGKGIFLVATKTIYIGDYLHADDTDIAASFANEHPKVDSLVDDSYNYNHELAEAFYPQAKEWLMQWDLEDLFSDAPYTDADLEEAVYLCDAWETDQGEKNVLVSLGDTHGIGTIKLALCGGFNSAALVASSLTKSSLDRIIESIAEYITIPNDFSVAVIENEHTDDAYRCFSMCQCAVVFTRASEFTNMVARMKTQSAFMPIGSTVVFTPTSASHERLLGELYSTEPEEMTMKEFGLESDELHFNALLTACAQCSHNPKRCYQYTVISNNRYHIIQGAIDPLDSLSVEEVMSPETRYTLESAFVDIFSTLYPIGQRARRVWGKQYGELTPLAYTRILRMLGSDPRTSESVVLCNNRGFLPAAVALFLGAEKMTVAFGGHLPQAWTYATMILLQSVFGNNARTSFVRIQHLIGSRPLASQMLPMPEIRGDALMDRIVESAAASWGRDGVRVDSVFVDENMLGLDDAGDLIRYTNQGAAGAFSTSIRFVFTGGVDPGNTSLDTTAFLDAYAKRERNSYYMLQSILSSDESYVLQYGDVSVPEGGAVNAARRAFPTSIIARSDTILDAPIATRYSELDSYIKRNFTPTQKRDATPYSFSGPSTPSPSPASADRGPAFEITPFLPRNSAPSSIPSTPLQASREVNRMDTVPQQSSALRQKHISNSISALDAQARPMISALPSSAIHHALNHAYKWIDLSDTRHRHLTSGGSVALWKEFKKYLRDWNRRDLVTVERVEGEGSESDGPYLQKTAAHWDVWMYHLHPPSGRFHLRFHLTHSEHIIEAEVKQMPTATTVRLLVPEGYRVRYEKSPISEPACDMDSSISSLDMTPPPMVEPEQSICYFDDCDDADFALSTAEIVRYGGVGEGKTEEIELDLAPIFDTDLSLPASQPFDAETMNQLMRLLDGDMPQRLYEAADNIPQVAWEAADLDIKANTTEEIKLPATPALGLEVQAIPENEAKGLELGNMIFGGAMERMRITASKMNSDTLVSFRTITERVCIAWEENGLNGVFDTFRVFVTAAGSDVIMSYLNFMAALYDSSAIQSQLETNPDEATGLITLVFFYTNLAPFVQSNHTPKDGSLLSNSARDYIHQLHSVPLQMAMAIDYSKYDEMVRVHEFVPSLSEYTRILRRTNLDVQYVKLVDILSIAAANLPAHFYAMAFASDASSVQRRFSWAHTETAREDVAKRTLSNEIEQTVKVGTLFLSCLGFMSENAALSEPSFNKTLSLLCREINHMLDTDRASVYVHFTENTDLRDIIHDSPLPPEVSAFNVQSSKQTAAQKTNSIDQQLGFQAARVTPPERQKKRARIVSPESSPSSSDDSSSGSESLASSVAPALPQADASVKYKDVLTRMRTRRLRWRKRTFDTKTLPGAMQSILDTREQYHINGTPYDPKVYFDLETQVQLDNTHYRSVGASLILEKANERMSPSTRFDALTDFARRLSAKPPQTSLVTWDTDYRQALNKLKRTISAAENDQEYLKTSDAVYQMVSPFRIQDAFPVPFLDDRDFGVVKTCAGLMIEVLIDSITTLTQSERDSVAADVMQFMKTVWKRDERLFRDAYGSFLREQNAAFVSMANTQTEFIRDVRSTVSTVGLTQSQANEILQSIMLRFDTVTNDIITRQTADIHTHVLSRVNRYLRYARDNVNAASSSVKDRVADSLKEVSGKIDPDNYSRLRDSSVRMQVQMRNVINVMLQVDDQRRQAMIDFWTSDEVPKKKNMYIEFGATGETKNPFAKKSKLTGENALNTYLLGSQKVAGSSESVYKTTYEMQWRNPNFLSAIGKIRNNIRKMRSNRNLARFLTNSNDASLTLSLLIDNKSPHTGKIIGRFRDVVTALHEKYGVERVSARNLTEAELADILETLSTVRSHYVYTRWNIRVAAESRIFLPSGFTGEFALATVAPLIDLYDFYTNAAVSQISFEIEQDSLPPALMAAMSDVIAVNMATIIYESQLCNMPEKRAIYLCSHIASMYKHTSVSPESTKDATNKIYIPASFIPTKSALFVDLFSSIEVARVREIFEEVNNQDHPTFQPRLTDAMQTVDAVLESRYSRNDQSITANLSNAIESARAKRILQSVVLIISQIFVVASAYASGNPVEIGEELEGLFEQCIYADVIPAVSVNQGTATTPGEMYRVALETIATNSSVFSKGYIAFEETLNKENMTKMCRAHNLHPITDGYEDVNGAVKAHLAAVPFKFHSAGGAWFLLNVLKKMKSL